MKNNLKFTFDVSNFEPISEDSENKLIGGFSASLASNDSFKEIDTNQGCNNCQGGNCASGCGGGQNISCNTTAGCSN
ncbi:hypothetical protein V1T75_09215 [Tenacibaculum sp. FZY0031]|uniref:hypothetical protein n=1 Tax=Tenacibaculum sp. FZY0031 TaxID=3116648 RepID=UPI002EA2B0D3|nr:hypothetical protein [Tenacibaculum sp. FZY0031]